jgi:DUF4097 and DUF4098 domain-containing protein YvlB
VTTIKLLGIVLLGLVLCLRVSTVQADPKSVQKEIDAAYARFNKAFINRVSEPMMDMLAPGFTEVDEEGNSIDRQQKKNELEFLVHSKNLIKLTVRMDKLTITSDKAFAIVQQTSVSVLPKETTPEKEDVRTVHTVTRRDYWIMTGGGWILSRSRVLQSKQTAN